jgi:hypothetical protein
MPQLGLKQTVTVLLLLLLCLCVCPAGDATTGNGFFANNFGFAYNGIPNVVPATSG